MATILILYYRAVLLHRPCFVFLSAAPRRPASSSPTPGASRATPRPASPRAKDTDWTQVLFKIFNIRTGTADILTG